MFAAILSSITVERGGCMGSCPVYALTLNDQGKATYVGEFNVPRKGAYTGYVNFAEFLSIVTPVDPCSLEDDHERWTDSPSLTLTMTCDGKIRVARLTSYNTMPPRFATIVRAMDGMMAYAGWTSVSTASEFSGTYVSFHDLDELDELLIGTDSKGVVRASIVRATGESCDALLLPKPKYLGVLGPIGEYSIAHLDNGAEFQSHGGAVSVTDKGNTVTYYKVSGGIEFMLRQAVETNVLKHSTLHCP